MDLHIETLLNGQVVQDARTSDMVFDPLRLVSFVSGVMTLLPVSPADAAWCSCFLGRITHSAQMTNRKLTELT